MTGPKRPYHESGSDQALALRACLKSRRPDILDAMFMRMTIQVTGCRDTLKATLLGIKSAPAAQSLIPAWLSHPPT
jgi:hypothetical protein